MRDGSSASSAARGGCWSRADRDAINAVLAMALRRRRLLASVELDAPCDDRVRLLNGNIAEAHRTNADGACGIHAGWGVLDPIANEYRQQGARGILRREFGDTFAQFCINIGDAAVASSLLEAMWKEEAKPCAQSLVIAIPRRCA